MTWQVTHTFEPGAVVLGAELATCTHCGTLLVLEDGKAPVWIRRRREDDGRVSLAEPPCVTPERFEAPW